MLWRDTRRQITVLFLHGGQFLYDSWAGCSDILVLYHKCKHSSDATQRPRGTPIIGKLNAGRCFALRFRLSAGRCRFPAASRLYWSRIPISLLYPAPRWRYTSLIPAAEICLSGEVRGRISAFGPFTNYSELHDRAVRESSVQVGRRVVPLPAGLTSRTRAFLDLTRVGALPSEDARASNLACLPAPHISSYRDALKSSIESALSLHSNPTSRRYTPMKCWERVSGSCQYRHCEPLVQLCNSQYGSLSAIVSREG